METIPTVIVVAVDFDGANIEKVVVALCSKSEFSEAPKDVDVLIPLDDAG